MLDLRQTVNYANYLKSQGWIVERINNINYFIKKLPIIGSVLKIQRPEKLVSKTINQLVSKYKPFKIIIEPKTMANHQWLMANGYKLSRSTYLPSKTLHLDLTKPIKLKKETRRCVRMGETTKIKEYSSPTEMEIFQKAWKNSVKFSRYVPSAQQLLNLRKSFPGKSSLFLASHNIDGSIMGGAIFTISSFARSNYITDYWQAFTSYEGRTSLSQYALLYQGILWAKEQRYKIFDFEGIYDDRFPNKSWLGFTHFKKQFGGVEILYPGCYVKWNLNNIFFRFR